MIKILLDKGKQRICEELFLQIMVEYLPFTKSEIYGKNMEEKEFDFEEVKNTRRILWNYPKLYRFLYLASENTKYPKTVSEAVKTPVYEDRLRMLLVGKHDEMIEGNRRKSIVKIIEKIGKIEETSCLLNKVFLYKNFSRSVGAKKLLKELGITACPYCNRMFISTIERNQADDGWNGTRAQFDHYFCKSIYPYLAVNFYNLIPSCGLCNTLKSKHDTYEKPMLYPYDDEMGQEYVFFAYPSDDDWGAFFENLIDHKKNINLKIVPKPEVIYKNTGISYFDRIKLEERLEMTKKTLHLNDLYDIHADYAENILRTGYFFNESYIKMLNERFPEMKFSVQDVKEFMYCKDICEEHWGQNILSKLTYDMDLETHFN